MIAATTYNLYSCKHLNNLEWSEQKDFKEQTRDFFFFYMKRLHVTVKLAVLFMPKIFHCFNLKRSYVQLLYILSAVTNDTYFMDDEAMFFALTNMQPMYKLHGMACLTQKYLLRTEQRESPTTNRNNQTKSLRGLRGS